MAVSAAQASTPGGGQSPLWFNEWPVHPVHLVIQPTGIAKIMARPIPSPEWSRHGPAVHTLPALGEVFQHFQTRPPARHGNLPCLEAVDHGALEGPGWPRRSHIWADVGGIGAGVGSVHRPDQGITVLLPAANDQRVGVSCLPPGAVAHGGAVGVGEGGGRMRASGIESRVFADRLRPPRVVAQVVALMGRLAVLQIRYTGQHRWDPGGRYVHG